MGFRLFDVGILSPIHNLKPICFYHISEKALEKQMPEQTYQTQEM